MASGTFKWHGGAQLAAWNKEIDFNGDAIKLMWSSVAYVPNQDTHDYKDDVTDEVTGTNVPATGIALTGCTMTYTGATNVFKLDADDYLVEVATATGCRVATIYDSTPASDATRPIIGSIVFDSDLSPNAAPLTVTFDAAGIGTITIAA